MPGEEQLEDRAVGGSAWSLAGCLMGRKDAREDWPEGGAEAWARGNLGLIPAPPQTSRDPGRGPSALSTLGVL